MVGMISGNRSAKAPVTARDRGQALRQAIHEARARAGIDTDTELALRSRVSYDTLMNWYSGATTPRPAIVRKLAATLDVPYGDLLAAYDGTEPEPVPLHEAVQSLILEIRAAMIDERRARAELMRTIAMMLAAAIVPPEPVIRGEPVREPAGNGRGR
jgi:transcriptional regulator with XRE-family HTH domain